MTAVWTLLVCNFLIGSVVCTQVSEYWRTDSDITWATTTGVVKFTSQVGRSFDCVTLCASVTDCLVLGFSDVTGTCKGYSRLQSTTGSIQASVIGSTEIIYKNSKSCGRAGFDSINDGHMCVKLFTNEVDWYTAKSSCESNHGHLVIIDTRQKMDALSDYLGNLGYSSERLWIGASDTANEGSWKWLNGQWVDLSYWREVILNDFCIERLFANSADCGRIVNKDLSDDHCSLTQKYICERTDIV